MFRFISAVVRRPARATFLALATMGMLTPLSDATAQPAPTGGSIHGFVAFVLPSGQERAGSSASSIQPGSSIFVPNIQVIARNIRNNEESAAAVTNPQGFFRTPQLQPGDYRICVSGTGFVTRCDDAVVGVSGPVAIMNHIVPIQPEADAVVGAVTLADHTSPCFWFRPSVSPKPLTASASLLNPDGKIIAGPVQGNVAGQYVLPVTRKADRAKLHVECDAGFVETIIPVRPGVTLQDLALPVSRPSILALDFTKNGVGIRRADPGDTISATVLARDPDGNPLHYAWTDDSGRTLNLPDAPTVQWPLQNGGTQNTLHVQVSNGKGGVATLNRSIQAGANAIFFSGHVYNRQTNASVAGATVSLNGTVATTDPAGNFSLSVPDAQRFVLNANDPGFALSSLVLLSQVVGIQVPLDPVQSVTVNGATGGTIDVPPGSGTACNCSCKAGDDQRFHITVEIPDTRIDIRHNGDNQSAGASKCRATTGAGGAGDLSLEFQPGSFATASGAAYTGTVTVEAFQYDLNRPNPIPGDFGAIYQGKQVRLGTFGAFHLAPRDAQGQPLKMVAGKQASVSLPIQPGQLAAAPATMPLFHYDEASGQWLQDGTLTRSGNHYTGAITHFSVFNADTVFPGGACVKVLLSGFVMPVTLDGTYYDPSVGSFHHNATTTSDPTIGVERMRPNQLFTLSVTDSASPPSVVTAALNSGPGLDPVLFPSGYDTDTVNYSHCNGPVTISNLVVTIASNQPYFLGPIFGGTITPDPQQNPTTYQQATDAQNGGTRDTLIHWKQANGFPIGGTPAPGQLCATIPGEACGLYFNNGDLKFGRDMHCRITNASTGATACYVSNFGAVGTDDAPTALNDPAAGAIAYEASGQTLATAQPTATVTMEYDPNASDKLFGVQFWAYNTAGNYLPAAALDSQGAKPIPEICMACHQGTYTVGANHTVQGAAFLPFDLDSFLDNTGAPFPTNSAFVSGQQQQFHALNNMIAGIPSPGISPPPAVAELVQPGFWYSGSANTVPFTFGQGAAQLPATPFAGHEPLYDSVVKVVCRTCHVAIPSTAGALQWTAYSQMTGGTASLIQSFACGPTAPPSPMPHAEVPFLRFWQQSMAATLAGELGLTSCPSPP